MSLNVQDFVSAAVKEGISIAPMVFMESLEANLRTDVLLSEAGSAQNYLQQMINEAAEEQEGNA